MSSVHPNPNCKRCNSCYRRLPLNLFSRKTNSRDGLRADCRNCAAYRDKMCYRRLVPNSPQNQAYTIIYPVKDNNRFILDQLLKKGTFSVWGTEMESLERVSLTLTITGNKSQTFSLHKGDTLVESIVHSGDFNSFIRYLGSALYDREIRLHLTEKCDI